MIVNHSPASTAQTARTSWTDRETQRMNALVWVAGVDQIAARRLVQAALVNTTANVRSLLCCYVLCHRVLTVPNDCL
jgi:hypothetical protein